jgi:hypothetical protein
MNKTKRIYFTAQSELQQDKEEKMKMNYDKAMEELEKRECRLLKEFQQFSKVDRVYFQMSPNNLNKFTNLDFVCGLAVYKPQDAITKYKYDSDNPVKKKCPRILLSVTWR